MEKKKPVSYERFAEIEFLLREISVIVKRKGREILDRFPVTPPQFSALLLLQENGDLTIGELSQKMFLACSTMTDLIDRMEKNEVVERIRDERDRRVVRIRLLDKGSKIIEEVLAARRQYLSDILSHLSSEETEQIQKHLSVLYHEMKKD